MTARVQSDLVPNQVGQRADPKNFELDPVSVLHGQLRWNNPTPLGVPITMTSPGSSSVTIKR